MEGPAVSDRVDEGVPEFVMLRCFDGNEFRVSLALVRQSGTIMTSLEDDECIKSGIISIPNITGPVLAMVIEYWMKRADAAANDDDLAKYDKEFIAGLSHDKRIDVIQAAYKLRAQQLFDLFVADVCTGKDVKEI